MHEKLREAVRAIALTIWSRIPTLKIRSANRISLDRLLTKQFKKLTPGVVLDVGAKGSPYVGAIPHTRLLTLDINLKNNPDICCDIHELDWEDDYFDTVVAVEVLEHLQDPQRAVSQMHRVLKSGGVTVLSTRFLYRYHPDPKDYYRFTRDSLQYLFRDFSQVYIQHHGNRLQAFWELMNPGGRSRVLLNVLNPLVAKCESKTTDFPLGFVVWAKK